MQKTTQLFINSNVPDKDLLTTAILDSVDTISINSSDQSFDQSFNSNYIRIGFLWDNVKRNIPFGVTKLIIDNYTFIYFKKEFYDYIKLYQNPLIVDLITCRMNYKNFLREVTLLKTLAPNVTIEYSIDRTGNLPDSNWIMESNNQSIRSIYFNDNILNYEHTLGGAGGFHSAFILPTNREVWASGYNAYGQLGNDLFTDSHILYQVSNINNAMIVTCGTFHTACILDDYSLWLWGRNLSGQIGNGNTTYQYLPVHITLTGNAIAVACGNEHTVAILQDGTVWAWGSNEYGQLGNGTTTDSLVPLQVTGIGNAVAVSCGALHTGVILQDGTVWTWGINDVGELGNGTTDDSHVPIQVPGITNALILACGDDFNAVVLNDGTVWTWGSNYDGQLGVGTTEDERDAPVRVQIDAVNMNGIISVACGIDHTVVVRNDGVNNTVWAWGNNGFGQYGNGTTTSSAVPVQISGIVDPVMVSCGQWFTVVLLNTSKVVTFGYNNHGQLGNNSTTTSHTPVSLSGDPNILIIQDKSLNSAGFINGDNMVTTGRGVIKIKEVIAGDIINSDGMQIKVLYDIIFSDGRDYVLIIKYPCLTCQQKLPNFPSFYEIGA
jgi:alpha-tubulin suppressor-like RCC1 family protein